MQHMTCSEVGNDTDRKNCVMPVVAWVQTSKTTWTLAAHVLTLVLSAQTDKQAHLSGCLDKLMTDVQRNLEPKNRDKFTQVVLLPTCSCSSTTPVAA